MESNFSRRATMHSLLLSQYGKLIDDRSQTNAAERAVCCLPPDPKLLLRAVEQSPAAIVITDATGIIEYVNPRFEEMTAYSAAEVLGQNPRLLKSGQQTPEYYRRLWETIASGQEWRGEFHNRKKTGDFYWDRTSISPVRDQTGRLTHFIAIKEDITAYKQAAQQIMLAAALVENTADVCIFKDHELRLLAINRAGARLIADCEPARLIGKLSAEVLAQNTDADLIQTYREAEMLAQTLPPGGRVEREETVVYADGSRHTHLTRYFPIVDVDGCLVGTGNISTNISERKVAEQELIKAKEEAEAASRAKSVFFANISHELRTPLNAINGVAATLLDDPATPPELRNELGLIQQSGESLLAIIEEVLLFSSIQAGKSRLDSRPFDLVEIVQRALRIVGVAANQKKIALTHWIDPRLPAAIVGDPQRLQQVLLNLLANAVKFTAHGRVHLGIRVGTSRAAGTRLECYIVDTGVGIGASAIPKLFLPFSQADDSVTRRFGGTGLGLAISKSLVELMGGRISVRSREGRGSAFRFDLPLAACPPPAVEPTAPPPPAPRGRLADTTPLDILVVDDIPTNREAARMIFRRLGYTIATAENGADALSAVEKRRFDLILLDVQMPVMDGLTAARHIRRQYAGQEQRPRLVALTANASPSGRQDCLDAGMDDFMSKPVLPRQIEAIVVRLFGASRPGTAPAMPATASPGPAPWIDSAHHAALAHGGGAPDWEFMADLHRTFQNDYAAIAAKLEQACAARDSQRAAELVHGLKGGALMLGWTRMAGRCHDLLRELREGTFAGWPELAPELNGLFVTTNNLMLTFLREGAATARATPADPSTLPP